MLIALLHLHALYAEKTTGVFDYTIKIMYILMHLHDEFGKQSGIYVVVVLANFNFEAMFLPLLTGFRFFFNRNFNSDEPL